MAAETNRTIEADSNLAGLPVYVDRRSMSVSEVLQSVAFGFRAQLADTKTGWRITRTDEDRKNILRDTRQFWDRRLTDWFEETDRQAQAASAFGDSYDQFSHYQKLVSEVERQMGEKDTREISIPINVTVNPEDLTPIGGFYTRLVKRLGVDKLTDNRPEVRRLWSNRPDINQLSFPDGDSLLAEFAKAERAFRARAKTLDKYVEPAYFTLRQVGGTYFLLTVYDDAGKTLGRYSGPPFDFTMSGPLLLAPAIVARRYANERNAWTSVDSESLQVIPFICRPGIRESVKQSELPLVVTNPDQRDPLDFLVRIGLNALAKNTPGKGFVAVPTDQMLEYADGCLSGDKMNVAAFEHLTNGKWEYERINRSGVTIFRSQDPSRWERTTVDRKKLATQAKALLATKTIGIAEMADAQFRLFPQGDSRASKRVLEVIYRTQPHTNSRVEWQNGEELAWIGAGLSRAGASGKPVSVDPNNEPFKTLINRGINSGWLRFESATALPDEQLDPAVVVDAHMFSPRLEVGVTREPAVMVFPGAAPDTNAKGLELTSVAAFGNMLGTYLAGPFVANSLSHPESEADRTEALARFRRLGFYHLGYAQTFRVDLYANPGVRSSRTLAETFVTQENLRFDQLPSSMQPQLLSRALDWVKLYLQGKVGQPVTPPPTSDQKVIPPFALASGR